jgi:TolB-like protein
MALHGGGSYRCRSRQEITMRAAAVGYTAVGMLLSLSAPVLHAQCSDGTPPPCGAHIVARPAVNIPSPSARARRFLVLPFRNVTRLNQHDWLVEGSTTMLSEALGRWQGVTVVPDEKLYPALKRAGVTPGSVIGATQVRRISEETGGWTAISGEVIATGGRVRITARAWDVPTNRELVRTASEVPATGDVRLAYDSVGLSLLRSAGLDSVTPDLAGVTTRNLDAYQSYLRGLAHLRRSEVKLALADFQASVRADSTFALGWARLAETQSATEPAEIFNPMSKSAQYAARAVGLSAKLPPRQRQLVRAIESAFRAQFTETRAALEGLVAADSADLDAMQQLVGLEMFDPILVPVPGGQRPRGSPMRAARLAKRVVELDPSRHAMFGVLAYIYIQAGVPKSAPNLGIDRAPASFQDLMQSLQQREHLRVYSEVLRDTIALVPAESLSFIPKDSLRESRKQARGVARAWAERWIGAAGSEAAPHLMISELYALDGEYPAALGAVAKAESLGVQIPSWSAPARRLFLLGKSGDLAAANRLADSLTSASFFKNPNNLMVNGDAATWAFGLHLLRGRLTSAAALLEQSTALVRMMAPQNPSPGAAAFRSLMGNEDPDDEPGIPRSFRARQLDTALAHVREFSASDKIGPWLPALLPLLAVAADPKAMRSTDVLRAADALAVSGRAGLAFELASNMIAGDSSAAVPAAAFGWFRAGAEALNATRAARKARFHAATAAVAVDRATFEWTVDDAAPFSWSLPETPPARGEYLWEVRLDTPTRQVRLSVFAAAKSAGAPPDSGTLTQLLPPHATRVVYGGRLGANGVPTDSTLLQSVSLRTEMAPGVLRLIVTDRGLLEELRRDRPAAAKFRFSPCTQALDVVGKTVCADEKVTISYP